MKTLKNAAVVDAKAEIVLCMIPGNRVGDCIRLVEFAARRGIAKSAKRSEADPWQAPVERVCRNFPTGDAGESVDIRDAGIKIGRGDMIVVVVHAEIIRDAALAVNPSGAGVQALRAVAAGLRGKRIHDAVGAARPIQPEIDIVLRATATSATTSSEKGPSASRTARGAEIVNQPEHDHVGAAVC